MVAPLCAVPPKGAIGGTCSKDSDCDPGPLLQPDGGAGDGGADDGGVADGGVPQFIPICFSATTAGPVKGPVEGFCTRTCNESADCGAGNFCDTDSKICMPSCCAGVTEGQACSAKRVCSDVASGFLPLSEPACVPGTATALDGAGCLDISDCNKDSLCRQNDLEQPRGMCHTVGCTVGNDATCAPGGDGHCVLDPYFELTTDNVPTTLCLDVCKNDNDCRKGDGYRCVDDPMFGKHCRHPEVGDSCQFDMDCGVSLWACRIGTEYPGGYCTNGANRKCFVTAETSCSLTSTCFDPDAATNGDEFCVASCDPAKSGRCRAGYTCTVLRQDNGKDIAGCVPDALLP